MENWANGWVESYLDALLSHGLSSEHAGRLMEVTERLDADKNVQATYYLHQIMGLDEGGLMEAWSRASSTRAAGSRDARLQYLSWRVWGMKQRRVRVRLDASKKPDLEDDQVVMAEEEELGERSDGEVSEAGMESTAELGSTTSTARIARSQLYVDDEEEEHMVDRFKPVEEVSAPVSDPFEQRVDKLHVVLISMHGLVRGERMELGRDPDTGGQVKYVVELARALADHPVVHRVDLLTRLIKDKDLDKEYGEPEICIRKGDGKMGGAYIVRLPCGPVEKYIRKEELWPHVREFADNGIKYVQNCQMTMSEVKERCELYVIHGHYADAGEVAALMAQTLGVDMVLTGHSLGRNKLDHLIAASDMNLAAVDKTYNINRRIEGEERALDEAIMVLTSTKQEISEQWSLYTGYDQRLANICQRRKGPYHVPTMSVIPPGLDFSNLKGVKLPTSDGSEVDDASMGGETKKLEEPRIWQEVARFLQNPRKPVILAMSRPDAKKNITTLIKAFGSNTILRDLANLVLVMGNRDVIDSMAQGSRIILEQVLKLVDAYDLYGSVAYPKQHKQSDISDIYHLPAATRGIFVNIALQEPFGLTLIEAGAHGVPIVATKNGGPVDIIRTLKNGILVDPTNIQEISSALVKILTQTTSWDEFSKQGINNIMAYSWPSHCEKYLQRIEKLKQRRKTIKQITPFSGSWDNSKFDIADNKAQVDLSGCPAGDYTTESLDLSQHRTPKLVDDNALEFDLEGRMAEEEKDAGIPRIAMRKKIAVFALDNVPMAKQALSLLNGAIKAAYGEDSVDRDTSPIGFGILSMLTYDSTCQLLDYESIEIDDMDLIIVNGGADVYIMAAAQEEMMSYEPYDIHIAVNWDKVVVHRLLERIRADREKKARLLKPIRKKAHSPDTGPNHILMEIGKETMRVDDVAIVDRIRTHLRNTGVRAQIILQVDKTAAGKGVAPLLHVMPLRASRAQAMRFVLQRHGISLDHVVLVAIASSISAAKADHGQSDARKAGFVVSDMYDLVGGGQKVVIVPPTHENQGRVPIDRIDARMIEKLQLWCGPDVYGDRVVILEEDTEKHPEIGRYLTV